MVALSRFGISRKSAVNTIPPRLTTLSVSWFKNQFKAVAIHHGAVTGTWERPETTEDGGDFAQFIGEAVQHTGYKGQAVSLVLAHPRLAQQLVELPPVKTAMVNKLVQRQALQQKFFPGEAAWACQDCLSSTQTHRVMLHLLPRSQLNSLSAGCRASGLHLTSVVPPSAVVHHQFKQLGLDKEEIGILAADTGGATTLVVARGDGQMLLARTLQGTWAEDAERLALDLNRSILFVNQQYNGAASKGLWLFGPGAKEQLAVLQRHLRLPVNLSPIECDPFYWPTELPKVDPDIAPNFIGLEQRKAPQRRVFAKVVALCTGLIVAGSLATSACCWLQARQETANIKSLANQSARLEGALNQLRLLDDELSTKQHFVQLILAERPPPAPAWMLAYLGEALPSDLVVTNLEVKRANGPLVSSAPTGVKREDIGWKVRLAGTFQPTDRQKAPSLLATSLAQLRNILAGAPFHMRITEDAEKAGPGQNQAKPTDGKGRAQGWLSRLSSGEAPSPAPMALDNFVIEGMFR